MNEHWFTFVDAREDDGLSHEEAKQKLIDLGVSLQEVEKIAKQYERWAMDTAFDMD